jgi:uncharacterized protein (DUF1330 family)
VTVYVLAQLVIHDAAEYGRYVREFSSVLRQYEGTLLAADESPAVAEGSWPYDKVVLIGFRDEAALWAWADSPEYARISVHRRAGADATVLVVRGT